MPFEAPWSALDDGAAIEEDGAGALELPEEAVSLPLHAVSDSAATAMTPIPATRILVTKITPLSGLVSSSELFVVGHSGLDGKRIGSDRVTRLTAR
jgi:hypothetical protein